MKFLFGEWYEIGHFIYYIPLTTKELEDNMNCASSGRRQPQSDMDDSRRVIWPLTPLFDKYK